MAEKRNWAKLVSLEDLNPVLSSPKRLACLGALSVSNEVEFGFVRSQLQLSDSDLSKQLKPLVESNYITSRKTGKGTTRRTWLAITDEGVEALEAHASVLRDLIKPNAHM